jgi:hypothetical protein
MGSQRRLRRESDYLKTGAKGEVTTGRRACDRAFGTRVGKQGAVRWGVGEKGTLTWKVTRLQQEH